MSNQYKAHERYIWSLTGVAGADTITAVANTTFKQYFRGQAIIWEAASNNTGAATININGAGAVALKKNGHSVALDADDLVAGVSYVAVHDGTNFQIVSGSLTGGGGGGSVTSVAQTVPVEFSVAGSPVTSSGTLAISKATQSANTVWAGPTSGGAAVPTFRALIVDDLPDLPSQSSSVVNLIMNGEFQVWQRGTSFVSVAANTYTADRWRYEKAGAMVHDVSRSTDVPTVAEAGRKFAYSILVDCTTADSSLAASDFCQLTQRVEADRWRQFAQRDCIMSFWVKGTKTGIHCCAVSNVGNDRCFVGEYTINTTDTWEYKSVALTASPSGGTWNYTAGDVGLRVHFTLAAGTDFHTTAGSWQTTAAVKTATSSQVNACDNTANNFRFTGVDVRLGSTAGVYVGESANDEIIQCKKYFEKSFPYNTTPAASAGNLGVSIGVQVVAASTSQQFAIEIRFQVEKTPGITPTITRYNPGASGSEARNITVGADCASTGQLNVSTQGLYIHCTTPAATAIGQAIAQHWTADAELTA